MRFTPRYLVSSVSDGKVPPEIIHPKNSLHICPGLSDRRDPRGGYTRVHAALDRDLG
jgi:hypothetical protein